MIIQNEANVRLWMRNEFPTEILWIEHHSGGTAGFFDCVLMLNHRLFPIELKFGGIDAGMWTSELRPSQVRVGEQMIAHGIESHILVGDENEKVLWMTSFSNYFSRYGTDENTLMIAVNDKWTIVDVLSDVTWRPKTS
jgi:hypothetical protein